MSLIKPRIVSACPVGGVVLDPFRGTGRTLAAAIESERRGLGFDIQPKFAIAASMRLMK
jgi:site-specific DNA-methyltransferase (cytosine-N4-specific)